MPGNIHIDELATKSFDIVVVGGGTSGLTLAAKLSEDPQISVLVLDAGDVSENDPKILLPAQYGVHFASEAYDWNFQTIPQKFSNGAQVLWSRGKVLGGSSATNFFIWTKPPAQDIDDWERLGNTGWNWKNLQRHMHELEGYQAPSAKSSAVHGLNFDDWHIGKNGPIKLMHSANMAKTQLNAYRSCLKLGIPKAPAPMDGDPTGFYFCPKSFDSETYRRSYAATAFYFPNKDRPNFSVLTKAYVTRLIINSIDGVLRAEGVEFVYEGQQHVVKVGREVVLCAGAPKSPHILELSGIGRKEVLQSIGVPLKLGLPGVGENAQEHMHCEVSFELRDDVDDISLDVLRGADPAVLEEQMRLFETRDGPFTVGVGSLFFSPLESFSNRAEEIYAAARNQITAEWNAYPEGLRDQFKIQMERFEKRSLLGELSFIPGFLDGPNPPIPGKRYFTVACLLNHNFSRGTVHSTSSDPLKDPDFDPHSFEHEIDLQTLVELVKFARKVCNTSPLSDMLGPETNPGVEVESDAQLEKWIKQNLSATFHTVGTLSMLPRKKGGVVDTQLKVYGTFNIRVADLSIVPLHVAAHTQCIAYGIGAQAAEVIKTSLRASA